MNLIEVNLRSQSTKLNIKKLYFSLFNIKLERTCPFKRIRDNINAW